MISKLEQQIKSLCWTKDGKMEYIKALNKDEKYFIKNEDCVNGARKHVDNETIDLIICDPPFGIEESKFDNLYARNKENVIEGYVEAPKNYDEFTLSWMEEARRILKKDGSFYIIIGHTNLVDVLVAAKDLNLNLVNHCIWKFNFGTATSKKFCTSHYHILYYTKQGAKPVFNTYCRFGPQEKNNRNRSLLYADMEDVWNIKKEYKPNATKNVNKLPDELIRKIIQYSSNENDVVCDFFMGNFTIAYVSLELGRRVIGFELNANAFEHHMAKIKSVEFGGKLGELKKVEIIKPKNQGKPLSDEEKDEIRKEFAGLHRKGRTKKKIIEILGEKYGRGKFSIINILK